ncbi:tRNA uridine-5-carboxymethylaminomethyl(34) synthesis GTPase MnmE [Sphingomonas gilva]|uniref:tRNA modification GTPase MnmE n=1 Tax=Sphingomonas gilva TaxID=2305907 RepID=A0A396RMY4_9SPHN|nr:tRNA uridine-5-carboxymethylaminomethyl(34) synthesis GTPase MnmE [Sphingomonas gilva]RHW17689.1 tRNA uridine-5-carboxymethylaminomethyl(34) synthesis GTPase MnmE [Sphingomonas gilva]
MNDRADTIVALSSGRPPAAIAVLRASGPAAIAAAQAIAGTLPPPRRAALRTLRDPADGSTLDRALVLVFPGPRSATGEDLVEFHVHGGRAVAAAVEGALVAQAGCRAAAAGEFTRRALENGRIDLVEAEGLADLLTAETESQRRRALDAAEGHVSRRIGLWADRVLGLSARAEAILDFGDEDDVAVDEAAIGREALALAEEMAAVLDQPPVERLHQGPLIALAGPPNSGKSTTLNALAGRDAAIVSPIPGTTRDRIELAVVREGRAYRLVDTAGLRSRGDDEIEEEGMARARLAVEAADLLLWLGDESPPEVAATTLWLQPRSDLAGRSALRPGRALAFSAVTGEGLAELWRLIADRCSALLPSEDDLALNARQRGCLREAQRALADMESSDMLVVAEHLRAARYALDRLLGRVGAEEMLDALFGRFCIGK